MFIINNITAKTILSAKNNMNLYRGCTHGCIYCDSRSEVYGKTYTFEDIEIKTNAIALLEKELLKKKQTSMLFTGSMTDPYLPLEKEQQLTKACLELVEKHGFGIAVLTKSDLVLRDIDLLQRIHKKSKCVVQMTLTTFDENLCKVVEPHVCTTKRRFEVLQILNEAGIPTVVWLTPILPFINDNEENIQGLLHYCKQANVKGIVSFGIGMTLRYGNREYFYQNLDTSFPGLKRKYMQKYGSSYGLKSPHHAKLSKQIETFCQDNQILYGEKDVFNYIKAFPQNRTQLSFDDFL